MKRIFYILVASAVLSACGLEQMAKKYDTTSFTTTPPTLETHAGKVALSFEASFQPKYFIKKATVDFTPVLVYEGGETAFKTITVQGEQATGGEATIFNSTGGNFSYSDHINYSDDMVNSNLELRAVAKLKDKEKILGPVNIAQGVIATSTRVLENYDLANQNDGYEYETIIEKTATIYFLVNQSNIRTTEKSDDDIKELKEFAKNGYKTHSIEIVSYASPEGKVNLNDNVSEKRMTSTLNYTKQLLRSLKFDGARNNDLYTLTSVGEDWMGFENLVDASNIKDKGRINRIVNSIEDVEVREQRIRDLAEVYDAIEDDILPQLRKATIIIRSYEPKKTDEEITSLATTNPEELDIKELLHAAKLFSEFGTESAISIYTKVVELHNDWRGHNNIACLYIMEGDLTKATAYLDKAEEIGGMQNDILVNRGIIAAIKGELDRAQKLFNEGGASEKNQAILDIKQGEYAKAARYYKGETTHNAVLVNILNGDNSTRVDIQNPPEGLVVYLEESLTLTKEEATNFLLFYESNSMYLNAIAAAREGNNNEAIEHLAQAIEANDSFKMEAANDLEFINLRENEEFKNLIN
tara:strand:+ start:184 stop:1932 length:1749 start_codon:yes stop_codon:yes gene_type:complete